MTIAYSDFVVAFPEFASSAVYPSATITYWIGVGYEQLNARILGTQLDLAVMLFAAHNTVLGARETKRAAAGGIVGEVIGPVTAKSVGDVSFSYGDDTKIDGAGDYNGTTYGQRLYRMLRRFGAGPHYIPAPRRVRGRFAYP